MSDDVTIRLATARDAGRIHAALQAMARTIGAEAKMTSTADDILTHGFGDDPAFETLIAEAEGTFAGFCLTFPSFSTWRGQRGLYVQDIYVDARFRGRRIGETLLRAAARRGRSRGARYLRLSVDVDNVRAQAFYQRIGIVHARDEQIHMIKGEAFEAFAAGEADRP